VPFGSLHPHSFSDTFIALLFNNFYFFYGNTMNKHQRFAAFFIFISFCNFLHTSDSRRTRHSGTKRRSRSQEGLHSLTPAHIEALLSPTNTQTILELMREQYAQEIAEFGTQVQYPRDNFTVEFLENEEVLRAFLTLYNLQYPAHCVHFQEDFHADFANMTLSRVIPSHSAAYDTNSARN
jgi:hypothetical protein